MMSLHEKLNATVGPADGPGRTRAPADGVQEEPGPGHLKPRLAACFRRTFLKRQRDDVIAGATSRSFLLGCHGGLTPTRRIGRFQNLPASFKSTKHPETSHLSR